MLPAGHYVPMDPLVTTTQISIYDDDYDFYADVTDGPGPYDHYDHEDDSTWTVLLYPETTSRCVRENGIDNTLDYYLQCDTQISLAQNWAGKNFMWA